MTATAGGAAAPEAGRRPRDEERGVVGGGGRPFAVVDIGSNSVRLVAYEGLARAPLALFSEKALVGLGRGLAATGLLNADAAAAALQALRRYGRIARAAGAPDLDVVATEAVRRARNGAAFLAEAEEACGARIDVLSGDEEARAAAAGVAFSFFEPSGVSGDLGGGSVDLAGIGPEGPRPPYGSLPLGTLPVGEAMARGRDAAERLVADALDTLPWLRGAARGRRFYVVGGGWRALARARLAIADAPLRVVHDYALSADEAVRLGRGLAEMPPAELATVPGLPRRRLETVPAAALLLERVVERLEPEAVVFSAFGLREGRLFARLPADELARDPLLVGAEAFGRARARMPAIGAAMADWTGPLLAGGETAAARRVRLAACELSDFAWREHPGARAREAFLRLVQYPFIGIGHADRVALALAVFARYEGSPDDPFVRPYLALAGEEERRRAELLGAALQLGFRVCGGVPDLLRGGRIERDGGELRLRLPQPDAAPEEDALRGRLKALARAAGTDRFTLTRA